MRKFLLLFAIATLASFSSESIAQRAKPLAIFKDCSECPEMIHVPTGKFVMGAPLKESAFLHSLFVEPKPGMISGIPHEGPQHEVIIDIPFAMGRNEITHAEWMACVEDGGCRHTPNVTVLPKLGERVEINDPRHPVISVSFYDALEFTSWLNAKVGEVVYRLPTEAEWEYAARAGTTTAFAQGDTLTNDQANFTAYQWDGRRGIPDPNKLGVPIVVDQLDAANAWGLRHMSGNVTEWTLSCFTKPHLGLRTSSAYLAAAKEANVCRRTVKGGGFIGYEGYARLAFRGSRKEEERPKTLGFRVLKENRDR